MLRPIIRTAVSLFLLSWLLPTVNVHNLLTLVIASVVVTFLYGIVRPILKILLLPINIITLGFFSTILNTILLFVALYIVPGFSITPMLIFGVYLNQFFSVMLISILIGFINPLIKIFI